MNERKSYRIDRHFMVSFCRLNSDEPYQMSQTRDISEDGLAIIAASPFQKWEQLQMMVSFPFRCGERVTLTAKVVGCTEAEGLKGGYRIGVQFVNLDSALIRELADYIETIKKCEKK